MAKKDCDKDCMTCALEQRSYCAVKMSMANQEILMAIAAELHNRKSEKVGLIVPNLVPIPTEEETEPTDSGAVTINE